jgi:hypothetical protein
VNSDDTDHFGTIHVHLFNRKGEELRHVVAFDSFEVTLGEESEFFRDVGYNRDVIMDLDGDGFKEVIIYFVERLWAPSGVTMYSLKDETSSTFMHCGHIQRFIVNDYDKDGTYDIIVAAECCYTNNSALIVLDPDHIKGSSPHIEGIPRFAGYDNNIAKYLILMPKSEIFKAQYEVVENYAQRPNIKSLFVTDDEHVQIGVCEWDFEKTGAVLLYKFGSDWRCTNVFGTGPYEKKFHELLRNGEIDVNGMKYREYERSLANQFLYMDGDTFVSKPTVNSSYTEFVKQ